MAFPTSQIDTLTPSVARVMHIEDITWGNPERNFVVRYRGRLLIDSAAAYDQLAATLRSQNVTPLFREEGGQHVVILAPGVTHVRPSNPWINLILFVATLFSVLLAGAIYSFNGPAASDLGGLIGSLLRNLGSGIPFAASILAILLAHEFGHYLAGRYHNTAVTLPYFLPFPFSPFGTLGAFIQLKEPPRNKRVLLDIGVAGPLAGLIVALPVLWLGLNLSRLDSLPQVIPPGQSLTLEGNSVLYLLMKYLVFGEWLPSPGTLAGLSPLRYWVRYFFTGLPTPLGGTDVLIHPVAWAGWAGLLVTALNLIPAGQLDGGHLMYTLLGRRARALVPFILGGLLLLGFVWSGWWLWAFLIFFLGRVYAEPLDQITPLDGRRRAVALLGLAVFILVFSPVPLRAIVGPYIAP